MGWVHLLCAWWFMEPPLSAAAAAAAGHANIHSNAGNANATANNNSSGSSSSSSSSRGSGSAVSAFAKGKVQKQQQQPYNPFNHRSRLPSEALAALKPLPKVSWAGLTFLPIPSAALPFVDSKEQHPSLCHICGKVGGTTTCSFKNCKATYHVSCARELGLRLDVRSEMSLTVGSVFTPNATWAWPLNPRRKHKNGDDDDDDDDDDNEDEDEDDDDDEDEDEDADEDAEDDDDIDDDEGNNNSNDDNDEDGMFAGGRVKTSFCAEHSFLSVDQLEKLSIREINGMFGVASLVRSEKSAKVNSQVMDKICNYWLQKRMKYNTPLLAQYEIWLYAPESTEKPNNNKSTRRYCRLLRRLLRLRLLSHIDCVSVGRLKNLQADDRHLFLTFLRQDLERTRMLADLTLRREKLKRDISLVWSEMITDDMPSK